MTQIIEAYFKNEDQALENEINLKKEFDVDILEVGPLEGQMKKDSSFLLPFIPTGGTNTLAGNGTGTAGSRAVGRIAAFKETKDAAQDEERGEEDVNYILSAKVKDDDVEDITNLLRNNHGHVKVSKQ